MYVQPGCEVCESVEDTELVNTPSPLLVPRSDRHLAGICPMFPSSPATSAGSTASTVMGLSHEAEAFVQTMKPSIRDQLKRAVDSHYSDTGKLFMTAEQQLSRFKGENYWPASTWPLPLLRTFFQVPLPTQMPQPIIRLRQCHRSNL